MVLYTLLNKTLILSKPLLRVHTLSRLSQIIIRRKSGVPATDNAEYVQILHDQSLYSTAEHNILIIQPARKYGLLRMKVGSENESFEEANSLIDTLGDWIIIDAMHVILRKTEKRCFFTTGHFNSLTEKIRSNNRISAVFINWPVLSGLQVSTLQTAWKKVVFDRYSLVLQIFKKHAKTEESRLQVALAEVPHLRSRLQGFHEGSISNLNSDYSRALSTAGESALDMKRRILENREHHLMHALREVQHQRDFLRHIRRKRELPLVSVLGYTNAGKTSLIRSLSGDTSLIPRDALFATLDVTNHKGRLPNSMSAIFVDTIGFIADIPTSLIAAFTTMINECLDTDLIVHVIDVSNSDWPAQLENVNRILSGLRLSEHLSQSMIQVATKTDRLTSSEVASLQAAHPEMIMVSNTSGDGLDQMCLVIQEAIVTNLGLVRRKMRLAQGGAILSWLYSDAIIERCKVCPKDPEKILVDALFTPKNWSRFQAKFHSKSVNQTS